MPDAHAEGLLRLRCWRMRRRYLTGVQVDSFLLFERLTVGCLDDAGRQAFHEESMVSTELLRLPRERIPPTVPALRAYLDEVMAGGILRMTDGAHRVADLPVGIESPPRRRLQCTVES
jgi:hypothetical protein